jgi:alkanesulfonate monooxygenase SsuD/methylene tetrahydromethanopterin reductase-like flavin-dependent oxidoreductase (luciferase family)
MAATMSIAQRPGDGRIGVALRDPLLWHDLVQVVRTAEEAGYESLFVPEIAGREGFSTLAGLAGATDRIRLATGVVAAQTRYLATTAMAAATVQELSGGRFVLGVGAGPPGPGSLDRVRRHVSALRAALTGHRVDEGEVPGFRLALPMHEPPPIFLAALGNRMISLAGEIADGVLLNWCTPERVARARELIEEGATTAGRHPGRVTVAVYVRACIDGEEEVALGALKETTGQYAAMPHYRRQMVAMGLGEPASAAAAAAQEGRPDQVPEELVRALCLVADPEAAVARLAEFREAGADLPIAYPVPAREPVSSIMGTVLALAPSPVLQP